MSQYFLFKAIYRVLYKWVNQLKRKRNQLIIKEALFSKSKVLNKIILPYRALFKTFRVQYKSYKVQFKMNKVLNITFKVQYKMCRVQLMIS